MCGASGKKGAPKQAENSGLWVFGHAGLGAGQFGRVAGEEVVHCLLGREPRYGGQHAEGIGRQEHDVARVGSDTGDDGVLNEVDGIAARVFSVSWTLK